MSIESWIATGIAAYALSFAWVVFVLTRIAPRQCGKAVKAGGEIGTAVK